MQPTPSRTNKPVSMVRKNFETVLCRPGSQMTNGLNRGCRSFISKTFVFFSAQTNMYRLLQPTISPITPVPTSCVERRFYYTVSEGCTNSGSVGPSTATFETSEQCCIVYYPAGECAIKDICNQNTSIVASKPTPSVRQTMLFEYVHVSQSVWCDFMS